MQRLHRPRIELRHCGRAGSAGFTLIELMVVLVVLLVVGSIAFAGFRQDEVQGQSRRFIDDVEGLLIKGRNLAIDQQTQVRVDIESTGLTLTAFDTVTDTWDLVDRALMLDSNGALLTQDDRVCIYGLQSGVQAPSQAVEVVPPDDCVGQQQRLQFEPDGSFSDPDATFGTVDNAGATLWIGDRSVSGQTKLTMIQVFPGGLIRSFEEVRE